MTLDQAKALKHGQVLHHTTNRNADGTPMRWRVNGKVQTWKRDSSRVRIPVKHGLYCYAALTQADLSMFEV